MGKFLRNYLIVTGLAALFTVAAPALVYLLAFFGVGLILIFTPTAFMWGCIFALCYGVASVAARPVPASVFAAIATAVAVCAIPQPSIRAADAALTEFHLDNVTPADPIRLQGDIRIETISYHIVAPVHDCDDRCIAILFEPGVSSVTTTRVSSRTFEVMRGEISPPNDSARTYRLMPKAQCGDEAVNLDGRRFVSPFGGTFDQQRSVAAEWSMKLATEYCLAAVPPLKRHDMILRSGSWYSGDARPPAPFDLSPGRFTARAHVADIRNGKGELLFRRYLVAADALGVPFALLPKGELWEFGWFRKFRPDYAESEWDRQDAALNAAIVVKRSAAVGDSIANARNAVQASFLDSTVASGPSAMLVIENYLALLAKGEPLREDVVLVERLLDDPRLGDLPSASLLPRIFSADQLNSFLPAIIRKLSVAVPVEPARENALGLALEQWPKAVFANPDRATLTLLQNPDLRLRASGLVVRLSDMGERGAPLLADILEKHLPAIDRDPARRELHRRTASAAIQAMCYLGTQAASQLPRMRQLEMAAARNLEELSTWDIMMLRLGKPLTEIRIVGGRGSSEQKYVSALSRQLADFDADQDCR